MKHHPNASTEIDQYISSLPAWSKKICEKLRKIALASDAEIIEDWKWGPNYYLNGMVCGFAAHKKFVNFVFFQGALLKDKKKLLIRNPNTLHNTHFKFTDIKEINEELLLEYIFEAIDNNKKGKKLAVAPDKTVKVPAPIKNVFMQRGVWKNFEGLNYARRKEMILYINDAKREETRLRRIDRAVELLKKNQGIIDKYTRAKA
jgi:uncharacterized protein YdeI (YjbR/CyaY-like superfamily)